MPSSNEIFASGNFILPFSSTSTVSYLTLSVFEITFTVYFFTFGFSVVGVVGLVGVAGVVGVAVVVFPPVASSAITTVWASGDATVNALVPKSIVRKIFFFAFFKINFSFFPLLRSLPIMLFSI